MSTQSNFASQDSTQHNMEGCEAKTLSSSDPKTQDALANRNPELRIPRTDLLV